MALVIRKTSVLTGRQPIIRGARRLISIETNDVFRLKDAIST